MLLIDSIEAYHVAMPLKAPFRTAAGEETVIHSLLVKMMGQGQYGWGEAAVGALPLYSPEWASAGFMLIRDVFAPRLVGCPIESGQELQAKLACFKANYFPKAALDTAWWDLYAKVQSKPLWQVLGATTGTVDVGEVCGVQGSMDELIARIAQAVDGGFKRVKIKCLPGWDVEVMRKVCSSFPDKVFHVDCNSGYTLDDTATMKQLDELGLAMIEQPLAHDDLVDHATLQQQLATPICLDESIVSSEKARKAAEIGSCKFINIKLGRTGGITSAIAIHDICRNAGIGNWVGGMVESAVGVAHNLAFAAMPNITYPSDVFVSRHSYDENLAGPEMVLSGPSQMTSLAAPGIGVEPLAKKLQRMTVERATIAA